MKHNPMIRSTLRRPLHSFLFVLVIAVASFAFVARAAEYLVVDQETQRLQAFYRPIGYVKPEMVDPMDEDIHRTIGHFINFCHDLLIIS